MLRERINIYYNTCFDFDIDQKYFALIEKQNHKEYIRVVNIPFFKSLIFFESPTKDCQDLKFIHNSNLLMALDNSISSSLYFMTVSGTLLKKINYENSYLFIKKIYLDGQKNFVFKLMNDVSNEIINTLNLTTINILDLCYLIKNSSNEIFFEEIQKQQEMAKIGVKKIQLQKYQGINILKKKITSKEIKNLQKLKFSIDSTFIAFNVKISDQFYLFIINLETEEILFCCKFMNKIKQLEWTFDNQLIIVCGNHIIYFWKNNEFYIAEKFFKDQVCFDNIELGKFSDKIILFSDTRNQKVCILIN